MFLKIFRNISCVRGARNNVAAFCHGRPATSQDTMLPPQCVLVLLGPDCDEKLEQLKRFFFFLVFFFFPFFGD